MIVELLPPHTGRAFEAMRALRPHLATEDAFVRQVDQRQRPAGYRLVASVPDERAVKSAEGVTDADAAGPASAVAGFRVAENLAWGRFLYVDDLTTVPSDRGRGRAGALLDWLDAEAARQGCGELHLDSGVGPERTAAHRLYFACGYRISSHHFARSR